MGVTHLLSWAPGTIRTRSQSVQTEDKRERTRRPWSRRDRPVLGGRRTLRYLVLKMARDAATLKMQTVGLGEPVTFEGADAEEFLAEIQDGPSAERQVQLRAAVAHARAVKSPRSANELFR